MLALTILFKPLDEIRIVHASPEDTVEALVEKISTQFFIDRENIALSSCG